MKVISHLRDGRIGADDFLLEASIEEYLQVARQILQNNEFQRRRVKSSATLYTLLKDDLRKGCVIPPIVLAIRQPDNTPSSRFVVPSGCPPHGANSLSEVFLPGHRRL